MKSTNKDNYKLIKAIAGIYCDERYTEEFTTDVFFEHGQFFLRVITDNQEITFSVADVECSMCFGEVDHCMNCGCYSGIDFEEIDTIDF